MPAPAWLPFHYPPKFRDSESLCGSVTEKGIPNGLDEIRPLGTCFPAGRISVHGRDSKSGIAQVCLAGTMWRARILGCNSENEFWVGGHGPQLGAQTRKHIPQMRLKAFSQTAQTCAVYLLNPSQPV